jgi:hypothetical protein
MGGIGAALAEIKKDKEREEELERQAALRGEEYISFYKRLKPWDPCEANKREHIEWL